VARKAILLLKNLNFAGGKEKKREDGGRESTPVFFSRGKMGKGRILDA